MNKKSYWTVGPRIPRFDRLEKDLKADVVGDRCRHHRRHGGLLLKKAGRSVVLLERDRCRRRRHPSHNRSPHLSSRISASIIL